jgi:hypothetical protein
MSIRQNRVRLFIGYGLSSIMNDTVSLLKSDERANRCLADGGLESSGAFQLIQRGDFIKPGWWHWRCRHEDGAGDVAYGYVQADSLGHAIAPETFEKDWS